MPIGKIYDTEEVTRINDFLNTQTELLKKADSEKAVVDKKMIQYAIIIGGAIISILTIKFLTRKK